MMNAAGSSQKFNARFDVPNATGVVGETDGYPVHIESKLRVETTGTITLQVQGRIEGSTVWTTLTVTSGVVDISTYDYIRFNIPAASTVGTLIASGFIAFF